MGMASAGHVYESEGQVCDQVQLSVVISCYNEEDGEEDGIEKLYERVTAVCRQEFGDDYEFLLVNEGSRDATWQKILALTDQDPRFAIHHDGHWLPWDNGRRKRVEQIGLALFEGDEVGPAMSRPS